MFEITIDFFWVMCLYTIVSEYYYLSESSQSHLCNCSINIVGVKFSQLFLPVYNQKLLKSLLLSSTVPPHTSVALVNILCSLISYLTNFVSGINILQFLAKAPYNLYFFSKVNPSCSSSTIKEREELIFSILSPRPLLGQYYFVFLMYKDILLYHLLSDISDLKVR